MTQVITRPPQVLPSLQFQSNVAVHRSPQVLSPPPYTADQLQLQPLARGHLPRLNLFDAPPSLAGQQLGASYRGLPLKLGSEQGQYSSLKSAQDAVLSAHQRHWNNADYALIQTPRQTYILHDLQLTAGPLTDVNDMTLYSSLRESRIQPRLPAGYRLTALVTDLGQMRFYQGEASPVPFEEIADPQRLDSLDDLDARAQQVLKRLQQMEAQLGPSRDHRGIFATMYRVITQRAYQEFQQFRTQGDEAAAAFEGRLLINFANKYFAAYDAYAADQLEAVPEVWRSVFDLGRQSQMQGYPRLSTTEIVGLSMVAHIIHDLPFSLQEIGFDIQDTHISDVYDQFNQLLMEEKNTIIAAIAQYYGETDLQVLESWFLKTAQHIAPRQGLTAAEAVEKGVFSAMRNLAKYQAEQGDTRQIKRVADGISDALRAGLPGA